MVTEYREMISLEYVRQALSYDPETGVILNKIRRGKSPLGAVSGNERPDGYRTICLGGKQYLAHRLAWLHFYGVWPEKHLDHIDQNPRNNAIANLRECTDAENQQNLRTQGYGTSGYLGVTVRWNDPSKWVAKIKLHGKHTYLGSYNCRTAAYVAYCKAKTAMHTFATGGAGSPANS